MMALHGFLGLPSDWNGLLPENTLTPAWIESFAALSKDGSPLWSLARTLNQKAREALAAKTSRTLVGYSMGGRIALHMLLDDPSLWTRAIVVSAHPGLKNSEEKKARIQQDLEWAQRFRTEPWQPLLAEWNAQSVFRTEEPMDRTESDFNRKSLAIALESGSTSTQDDLRSKLATLSCPVLWLAGERDQKYRSLAQECADLNPRFECRILPSAGHRAPWANPKQFQSVVTQFLMERTSKGV